MASVVGQSDLMAYYGLEKRRHSKISKPENGIKLLWGVIRQNDRGKRHKVKTADGLWPMCKLTNTLAGK